MTELHEPCTGENQRARLKRGRRESISKPAQTVRDPLDQIRVSARGDELLNQTRLVLGQKQRSTGGLRGYLTFPSHPQITESRREGTAEADNQNQVGLGRYDD